MTTLIIDDMGGLRHIYSDELREFDRELGEPIINRASYVEPDPDGNWQVDLRPVGGARCFSFPLRSDALAFEVAWLEKHGIPEVQ